MGIRQTTTSQNKNSKSFRFYSKKDGSNTFIEVSTLMDLNNSGTKEEVVVIYDIDTENKLRVSVKLNNSTRLIIDDSSKIFVGKVKQVVFSKYKNDTKYRAKIRKQYKTRIKPMKSKEGIISTTQLNTKSGKYDFTIGIAPDINIPSSAGVAESKDADIDKNIQPDETGATIGTELSSKQEHEAAPLPVENMIILANYMSNALDLSEQELDKILALVSTNEIAEAAQRAFFLSSLQNKDKTETEIKTEIINKYNELIARKENKSNPPCV